MCCGLCIFYSFIRSPICELCVYQLYCTFDDNEVLKYQRFSMKALISTLTLLLTLMTAPFAANAQSKLSDFNSYDDASSQIIDQSLWAEFLEKFTTVTEDNQVQFDYAAVTTEAHALLKSYIKSLEMIDPTTLNKEEAFVYWVNMYNAVTVDEILNKYPVSSILKIRSGLLPGPWKKKLITVNGTKLSLDNVEHGILRKFWNEPRVHYAVNCASIGCPNLSTTPFIVEGLDEKLTQAAINYVNHPRGVTFAKNKLQVSSIYKWFKEDFGTTDENVIAHIQQYASPALKEKLANISTIHKYKYSWKLNSPNTNSE